MAGSNKTLLQPADEGPAHRGLARSQSCSAPFFIARIAGQVLGRVRMALRFVAHTCLHEHPFTPRNDKGGRE